MDTTTTLPLKSGVWAIDTYHSSVVFSIRHLGLSKVRGRFDKFTATLEVGATLSDIKIEADIEMASVDTNNERRDEHIRSSDFFNVDANPTMRFVSTRITGSESDWVMEGEITINGITKPISLDVEFNGIEDFQGTNHSGFTTSGELRRSDFGINFGLLPIGGDKLALADTVKFELDLQFIEP